MGGGLTPEPSGDMYDWTRTLAPESPWRHAYHQTLVMKLFLCRRRGDGSVDRVFLTFAEALDVLARIDRLTPGVPKIAYLVGWQHHGHDSKYPDWSVVNATLKRAEDATARDSLRWLFREAKRHHTTISLHVNMIDAYEDSPLWAEYLARDVIAKDVRGRPIPGETFDGVQSYQISYAQEWRLGLAQRRILGLLEMLPELRESGTIHLDAFHSMRPSGVGEPITPYLGIPHEEEVATQRRIFRFFRQQGIDVTCEGGMYWLRTDPFIGLQPMAWHFRAQNFVEEHWRGKPAGFEGLPPSLYCGTPFNAEPIVMADSVELPGFVESVKTRLAPWLVRNRVPTANPLVEDGEGAI